MNTEQKTWTINAIRDANRDAGYHWFDSDTLRFFASKVYGRVYQGENGIYFVSSEKSGFDDEARQYKVRVFNPDTSNVDTYGDRESSYKDRPSAERAAIRAAGRNCEVHYEDFVAPTAADDLLRALAAESAAFDLGKVQQLIQLAKRHHRGAERECNEGGDHTTATEKKIVALLAGSGIGAIFSGDPRGCTVRLKMPSGRTNDFANTGWCITTN